MAKIADRARADSLDNIGNRMKGLAPIDCFFVEVGGFCLLGEHLMFSLPLRARPFANFGIFPLNGMMVKKK